MRLQAVRVVLARGSETASKPGRRTKWPRLGFKLVAKAAMEQLKPRHGEVGPLRIRISPREVYLPVKR
jgi:hypothetical protein